MGFSPNQARLLTLTGRRCDLEHDMQVILNNKLNIAQDTAKIAEDYNDAVSNKKLFVFQHTTDETKQSLMDLNPTNLYKKANYLVVERSGTSYNQLSSNLSSSQIEEGLRDGTYFIVQEATAQTQNPHSIAFTTGGYLGGGTSVFDSDLVDDDGANLDWEIVDWRSSTFIMDKLDDSDDVTAQADYEAKMEALNVKETKMDIEMNKIESEHKAIAGEIESVKKIITKNTEDAFKYFS